MKFSNLPEDVKTSVFDFVKRDSYLILGSVCRGFNAVFGSTEKKTSSRKYLESVELFRHSLDTGVPHEEDVVEHLGKQNTFGAIPAALRMGYEWDHFCVEDAAVHEREDFFLWLKATDLFWLPENAYYAAAEAGKMRTIEFLLANHMGYPDSRAYDVSIRNDHLEVAEKIAGLSLDPGYEMSVAIRADDLETVRRLKASDVNFGYKCVQEVCTNGSTKVFEFLEEHDVYPTKDEFLVAVEFGNTELVGLFNVFFPELVDSTATSFALYRGQKEMLRFLVDIGVPRERYVDGFLTEDDS